MQVTSLPRHTGIRHSGVFLNKNRPKSVGRMVKHFSLVLSAKSLTEDTDRWSGGIK